MLVLFRFEAGIGVGSCFFGRWMVQSASVRTFRSSPLSKPSGTMASVVNLHVLNSGHCALSVVSGFSA